MEIIEDVFRGLIIGAWVWIYMYALRSGEILGFIGDRLDTLPWNLGKAIGGCYLCTSFWVSVSLSLALSLCWWVIVPAAVTGCFLIKKIE